MKPICVLVLILSFTLGCKQEKTNKDILGHWWSTQEDSSYFELYINEIEFVLNHASYGPIPRKYEYHFDTIYLYNFENEKLGKWRIVDSSDSVLVLSNQEEEYKLYRINIPNSYFESYQDSLDWESFEEEFHLRYLKRRYQ
ncbi:hypothetical protein LV84_01666 [Algoriphagus ratkowskyi]|uniref:Lipocalin-like protein n=1 Tax=Algoriphagus ratkowskyi TaxID=57028 RepID=A0A2W7RC15_9BACT|nr:hypothetical protein [Algoriphagus ratkowskyi]PZX58458.1 hypothetical protein LV84_01666 [Algoriphagus ratkowskyi]TXD77677.1 hypothetical protein ESW18_09900 [Algoriphagus ratkowskyi]